MRTITVIDGHEEQQHESFAQAVSQIRTSPRSHAAERTTAEISGATVVACVGDVTSLDILLSGERALHIYVAKRIVDWSLIDAADPSPHPVVPPIESIKLEFQANRSQFIWDRAGILALLVGKRLCRVSAAASWLFVTVEGAPTLMFMALLGLCPSGEFLFYAPE